MQVFTGETLEEAMATAVAALGPDLVVRRARKVRAGVRGLLGRDRYEVLAVPGSAGAASGSPGADADPVGSALGALLDAADEQELTTPLVREVEGTTPASRRAAPVRPTAQPAAARPTAPPAAAAAGARPAPSTRTAAAAPVGRRRSVLRPGASTPVAPAPRALEPAAPVDVVPLAARAGHPDPAVADHPGLPRARGRRARAAAAAAAASAPDLAPGVPGAPADQPAGSLPTGPPVEAASEVPRRVPEDLAPTPRARAVARPAPVAAPAAPRRTAARPARAAAPGSGWSRERLEALGVPAGVLDQLPGAAPRDDLGWVVALTAAIEAAVPAPHEPDDEHPVVVSGHGLAGAVAVLDAGCRGAVPGTIGHAGRTAPATATELALVLRHHLTQAGA